MFKKKSILLFILLFIVITIFFNIPSIQAVEYSCMPGDKCLNKAPLCGIVTDADGCNPACGEGISCCKCHTEEEIEVANKKKYGNYDLQDILIEAIKISNKLLGIVGSVALLFFIIAGMKMIFAGGTTITDSNKDKITSAKTMMVQTIIGLVIFLSAYLIVSFIQSTLLDEESGKYQLKEGTTYFKNR
jgi:hypothetical protein